MLQKSFSFIVSNTSLHITICFLGVYALSSRFVHKSIQYQILYIFLFSLIFSSFLLQKSNRNKLVFRILTYEFFLFSTYLVATTGWFSSPFSYLFYFTAVLLSLFFTPITTLVFIASLCVILIRSLPLVSDVNRAFLTILSVLSMLPISMYLRQKYLELKEEDKDILILNRHKAFSTLVEKELDNRVTNFSSRMRDSLTFIKQSVQKNTASGDQISIETDKALKMLTDFEEQTTGKQLRKKEVL